MAAILLLSAWIFIFPLLFFSSSSIFLLPQSFHTSSLPHLRPTPPPASRPYAAVSTITATTTLLHCNSKSYQKIILLFTTSTDLLATTTKSTNPPPNQQIHTSKHTNPQIPWLHLHLQPPASFSIDLGDHALSSTASWPRLRLLHSAGHVFFSSRAPAFSIVPPPDLVFSSSPARRSSQQPPARSAISSSPPALPPFSSSRQHLPRRSGRSLLGRQAVGLPRRSSLPPPAPPAIRCSSSQSRPLFFLSSPSVAPRPPPPQAQQPAPFFLSSPRHRATGLFISLFSGAAALYFHRSDRPSPLALLIFPHPASYLGPISLLGFTSSSASRTAPPRLLLHNPARASTTTPNSTAGHLPPIRPPFLSTAGTPSRQIRAASRPPLPQQQSPEAFSISRSTAAAARGLPLLHSRAASSRASLI